MSARYVLPVFNNLVNIWRHGRLYTDPPDIITTGNLALGRRVSGSKLQSNLTNPSDGGMWLLVPKDTDIRDSKAVSGEDMVEVPATTGRLYVVKWVDDIGKGFANEHRFAVIFGLPPWGVPFPGPPVPPPPPPPGLPWGQGFPYPFTSTPFSFTFTPGQQIFVYVWQVNTSGTFPNVVSTSQGTLFPWANQNMFFSGAFQWGMILGFVYVPTGSADTLTLVSNDSSSTSAWFIVQAGAGESQYDRQASNFPANMNPAVTLSVPLSGGGNSYGAFIDPPGQTFTSVDAPYIPLAFPGGGALVDGLGNTWEGYFFGVSSVPSPSVVFRVNYGSPADTMILAHDEA